jgi:hypothetical protein
LNILTKISIVILVVLILAATPIIINQATTVPNYRLHYEKEVQQRVAAEEQTRQANFAAQRANQKYNRLKRDATTDRTQASSKIEDLERQLAASKRDGANLQNDVTKIRGDLGKMKEQYKAVEERRVLLSGQLDDLRKKYLKLTEDYRAESEKRKEKEADNRRLELVAGVLRHELENRRQTIEELDKKLRELQDLLTPEQRRKLASDEKTPDPIPDRPIEGTLTALTDDVGSINVGSAKGVKQGMKLIIFRGGKFVAHFKVSEVDINESVGIVIDRQVDPIKGDKVMSRGR